MGRRDAPCRDTLETSTQGVLNQIGAAEMHRAETRWKPRAATERRVPGRRDAPCRDTLETPTSAACLSSI